MNSFYLPTENTFSQGCLNKISEGTAHNYMKLNSEKTKYMLINFCKSYQFNTRLYIQNEILHQIHQTRFLGVVVSDDLSWMQNTVLITKKANQKLIILRKLYKFNISKPDMIQIYNRYIR